jgi:uncharacterized YigZ family protein
VTNKNTDSHYYFSIEMESIAEFKDRGSRFLSYAFPISSANDFKKRLKELKEEHPKAVHYCFAYRIGNEGNNFRSSDDGEPSGSAGRPILGQIDSKGVTNTAIIVVRYFGGTLLGVPGLINAYKTSASFALQLTPVIKKPVMVNYRLQFDYTVMNEVMRVIKKYECVVLKQDMQLFCVLEASVPKASMELCLLQLKNMKGLELLAI